MGENIVRINCDNELFIECMPTKTESAVSRATDIDLRYDKCRSAPNTEVLTKCRSSQRFGIATDYSSIKRIYSIASPDSKTTITNYVARLLYPNKMTIEFPIHKTIEEELIPPSLYSEIPFVSVHREQLRKAFEFCNYKAVLYLLPETLCIQCNGMKISLKLTQSVNYEGAYLEFEQGVIEQIVRFLGSLHHTHVKLHIHKDLIFRIVAHSSNICAFKSDLSITLYCGHS